MRNALVCSNLATGQFQFFPNEPSQRRLKVLILENLNKPNESLISNIEIFQLNPLQNDFAGQFHSILGRYRREHRVPDLHFLFRLTDDRIYREPNDSEERPRQRGSDLDRFECDDGLGLDGPAFDAVHPDFGMCCILQTQSQSDSNGKVKVLARSTCAFEMNSEISKFEIRFHNHFHLPKYAILLVASLLLQTLMMAMIMKGSDEMKLAEIKHLHLPKLSYGSNPGDKIARKIHFIQLEASTRCYKLCTKSLVSLEISRDFLRQNLKARLETFKLNSIANLLSIFQTNNFRLLQPLALMLRNRQLHRLLWYRGDP